MRYHPDAELHGFLLSDLHQSLRLLQGETVRGPDCFARASAFYQNCSAKRFAICVGAGLMEEIDPGEWALSEEGMRFVSQARFVRGISRERAARLMRDLVERANQFNRDASEQLLVSRLFVFGDFLNEALDLLEQVSFRVELAPRVAAAGLGCDELEAWVRSALFNRSTERRPPLHAKAVRRLRAEQPIQISLEQGAGALERELCLERPTENTQWCYIQALSAHY